MEVTENVIQRRYLRFSFHLTILYQVQWSSEWYLTAGPQESWYCRRQETPLIEEMTFICYLKSQRRKVMNLNSSYKFKIMAVWRSTNNAIRQHAGGNIQGCITTRMFDLHRHLTMFKCSCIQESNSITIQYDNNTQAWSYFQRIK